VSFKIKLVTFLVYLVMNTFSLTIKQASSASTRGRSSVANAFDGDPFDRRAAPNDTIALNEVFRNQLSLKVLYCYRDYYYDDLPVRDYVHVWQCGLTHTNDFSSRAQQAVQAVVSALSNRVRHVDWIPFLTTR
jgi:hypothetical protein